MDLTLRFTSNSIRKVIPEHRVLWILEGQDILPDKQPNFYAQHRLKARDPLLIKLIPSHMSNYF